MKRFPTTVAGLDGILHGGLFEGGVYIFEGPPGVGKTTLANQIAYNHAKEGGKTLYVTMLSESHARMVQHMEGQTFFQKSAVNSMVFYLSGYREFEQNGLKAVVSLLRGELARSGATLLVIDGLVVSAPAIDEGVRQFVHELQSLVTAMNCTCLLLTSGRGNALSAEQSMVDGIFAFDHYLYRGRAERLVQVCKFRGSEVVRGQHAYCITNDGIHVFPRLESMPMVAKELPPPRAANVGIPDLDGALKDKGVCAGSSSVVIGESGSGKTLLALRFAVAAKPVEPVLLLLGSPETAQNIFEMGARFDIPLEKSAKGGTLFVHTIGQSDESLDEMGHKILRLVEEHGIRRVVLDSAAALADTLAFPERGYRFIGRLLHELKHRHVTSLFTLDPAEIAVASGTPLATGLSALFDNAFSLEAHFDPAPARRLTVRKIRGMPTALAALTLSA